MKSFVIILLLIMTFLGEVCSTTKTITSGSWLVSGNWSPTGLPNDGDTIIIDGSVSIPADNNDITLNGIRLIVTGSGYLTMGKKCDLNLDANSSIIVLSGGTIEGTHGNSVAIIGSSGNLVGNGTWSGPRAANSGGWNVGSTSPLPIELTSFVVEMLNDKAHLEWITASEINNDYFEIERLMENEKWQFIGQVQGNGTTNELHFYEYDDYDVDPYVQAFYRLKQVDFDGKGETFNVVKAEALKSQGHDYKVLRTNDLIEIQFEDNHEELTEILLIDAFGNILQKEVFDRAEKGQKVSFDLTQYLAGWYIVGISGTDNMHFEKMIRVD